MTLIEMNGELVRISDPRKDRKYFILYYKNGELVISSGVTIEDAIGNRNIQNKELEIANLTCYEEGDKPSLFWNDEHKNWFNIDARKRRILITKVWRN